VALALAACGPARTVVGSSRPAEVDAAASAPAAVETPVVKGLPVGEAIAKLTDAGFAVTIAESSNEPTTAVVVGGQSSASTTPDGLQTVSLVVRPFTESSDVTTDSMEVSRETLQVVVLLASSNKQLLEASLPAVQRYSGPLGQVSIQTQSSFEPTLPADYVVVALFENKVMAGRFAQQMRELGFPATVLKARRISPAPVYINKDEPDS
jgi:hypothetical protein